MVEEEAGQPDYDYEGGEVPDASKYIAENRREALGVLFPSPDEMTKRINLITKLKGRAPDIYVLYLAAVEYEGWLSLEEGRPINWEKLDPVKFLMATAPSIQGWRASQAVEIARATPPAERRRSLADLIRGR